MYIKKFSEISKSDTALVGGKGASLGEMTQAGLPVPPGFVVTTETYRQFINQELPVEVKEQILEAFDQLGSERVAVRSSAVAEDSISASWAGQLESYLNVTREELIDAARKCWQSIKSERALAYAAQQNVSEDQLVVAVVVQKMVESEASGVMFSVNPISKDPNEVMIEAGFGLGEMLVQGMISPDNFVLTKEPLRIKESTINVQEVMLIYKDGQNQELPVPNGDKPALTEDHVRELSELAIKIEQHYGKPQDIEWALENGEFFIVQSRPITTIEILTDQKVASGKVLLEGIGASPGIVSGKVRVITDLSQIASIELGEILVTEKTTPDFIEAFGKVVAVVTNSGGVTSHAAIISRELGIPAVVRTKMATQELIAGQTVTVDGNAGKIYEGTVSIESEEEEEQIFQKLEKSGDEITDMINACTRSVIDMRELWPVSPGQLFTYIDFDQSYDMYKKLKFLVDQGWTFKKIASLFRYPTAVKFFMMNSAVTGLKVGATLNLAPITLDDNVQMFKWLIEILKNLTQEDPFAMEGKNIVWDKQKLAGFVDENNWTDLSAKDSLRAAVNLLSVNLFTLNWSFYTDYYGADGSERHGPYPVEDNFGADTKLLVRDFFNLKPVEIWPLAEKAPVKSVVLAQVYKDIPIYLGWGNGLLNQKSLTKHNTHFTLLVDGKSMEDEVQIRELANTLGGIAKQQADYVNSLDIKDKIRKCAMVAYYGLKDFHLHFSDKWYDETLIEKAFEMMGNGPLQSKEVKDMTLEEKRKFFDPRTPWQP